MKEREGAAVIYYNGPIITMEEEGAAAALERAPEAVLTQGGRVAGVGRLRDLQALSGGRARLADLGGSCLMPSFIDAHSHIVLNGKMSAFAQLGDCGSFQDIVDALRRHMEERDIREGPVIGFGYDHNFLQEQRHPDRGVLDQVSRTLPVILLHASAHMACANSRALSLAGITAESADPEGGVIGRAGDGREPSGYLEEAGMAKVQRLIESGVRLEDASMVHGMQEDYLRYGVTTAQEGAAGEGELSLLKDLSSAGRLKVDVAAYLMLPGGGAGLLRENRALAGEYRNRLRIGGYKLVLDGSPQGRSAWMSRPYLGGEPGYCGYPYMTDEAAEAFMRTAVEERRQLLVHCNGDAASEQFLRVYGKVLRETGCREDLRPVMIHCQTTRRDQLERMAEMGIIASLFVGHTYYWGDVHRKNLGEERGGRISPARDALNQGVRVTFHQDAPVTKPDMLHTVWAAVNRVSREGRSIGAGQAVTVYEALQAVTSSAAFQYFEEDSKGSIRPGKRADLLILDRSPLLTDKRELRRIRVLETIKDGVTLYRAARDAR